MLVSWLVRQVDREREREREKGVKWHTERVSVKVSEKEGKEVCVSERLKLFS